MARSDVENGKAARPAASAVPKPIDSPERNLVVETVASRLRELRASKGLKQSEVAAIVGCDGSSVSKWESGRHSTPSCPELLALAELYGVSASYILGQADASSAGIKGRALIDRRLLDQLRSVRSASDLDVLIKKYDGHKLWVEIPEGAESVESIREAVREVRKIAETLAERFPDSPHPQRLLRLEVFP